MFWDKWHFEIKTSIDIQYWDEHSWNISGFQRKSVDSSWKNYEPETEMLLTWCSTELNVVGAAVSEESAGLVTIAGFSVIILNNTFAWSVGTTQSRTAAQVSIWPRTWCQHYISILIIFVVRGKSHCPGHWQLAHQHL